MLHIVRFLASHPLASQNLPAALYRVLRYQLLTRIRGEVVFPWVEGARLVVRRPMTGASGNIYAGLHEYMEMGFLLHFLRPEDLFLDVGANVGSWTILASAVCGARTIALEPDPAAAAKLARNVAANDIGGRVEIRQVAAGADHGRARFTIGLDTVNRFAGAEDARAQEVAVVPLDSFADGTPALMKIDVEGFEDRVIEGGLNLLASSGLQAVFIETVGNYIHEELARAGLSQAYYDPATRILSREPNGIAACNSLFVRDFAHCQERLRTAPVRKVIGISL